MLCNKTITIHNEYEDENGKSVLQSTAIADVYIIKDESVTVGKSLTDNADVIFSVVPHSSINGLTRKLVDKFVFDNSSEEDKKESFTIAAGDFVSFGDVSEGIESLSDYRNETGNAYEISAVGNYDVGGMPHYEVNAH